MFPVKKTEVEKSFFSEAVNAYAVINAKFKYLYVF